MSSAAFHSNNSWGRLLNNIKQILSYLLQKGGGGNCSRKVFIQVKFEQQLLFLKAFFKENLHCYNKLHLSFASKVKNFNSFNFKWKHF